MPHEIEIRDGEASMFYVGQVPWHGLGTPLDRPATAAEAIKAAHLDWNAVKKPIVVEEHGKRLKVPHKFAMVREDLWGTPDCSVLGIVGDKYTPLQNRAAFEFFDPIVDKRAAIYHTAGALRNGERVWILAKLPGEIQVIGNDISNKFLLLSNSHDGNSSVQIKFTPIRVVCQNTLTMALSQGPTLHVAHVRDLRERLRQAERTLGLVNRRFEEIEAEFQRMVRVHMVKGRLKEYLDLVFPDPKAEDNEEARKQVQRDRGCAEHFFSNGKGNQVNGVRGTLWAAYNGVAENMDYGAGSLSTERGLNSAWFGRGYLTKARAFTVADQKLQQWLN